MGIGEQFAGLDMKNLIGGPLSAAAESSVLLAQSTADFINRVGFDANQNVRNVQFKYTKQDPDPDGNFSTQEMSVEIPLLAIVPIPNLQIDEVNILFDMEVKQSERSESATDASAALEAAGKIGPFKVSIKGSVSTHSSNTRSSDNSAKYHVDVRATNHGTPEGLARVLDMMAANVAPNLLSSRATDESGKELTGKSKERNLKLKQLRQERFQLESAETAARDTYERRVKSLKEQAKSKNSAEQSKLQAELNAAEEKDQEPISKKMESANQFWGDFLSTVESHIEGVAASEGETKELSAFYSREGETVDWTALNSAFSDAVSACRSWNDSTSTLDKNKTEYNAAMMS